MTVIEVRIPEKIPAEKRLYSQSVFLGLVWYWRPTRWWANALAGVNETSWAELAIDSRSCTHVRLDTIGGGDDTSHHDEFATSQPHLLRWPGCVFRNCASAPIARGAKVSCRRCCPIEVDELICDYSTDGASSGSPSAVPRTAGPSLSVPSLLVRGARRCWSICLPLPTTNGLKTVSSAPFSAKAYDSVNHGAAYAAIRYRGLSSFLARPAGVQCHWNSCAPHLPYYWPLRWRPQQWVHPGLHVCSLRCIRLLRRPLLEGWVS